MWHPLCSHCPLYAIGADTKRQKESKIVPLECIKWKPRALVHVGPSSSLRVLLIPDRSRRNGSAVTLHMWFSQAEGMQAWCPNLVHFAPRLVIARKNIFTPLSGLMDLRQPWWSVNTLSTIKLVTSLTESLVSQDFIINCTIWYSTSFTLAEFCIVNGMPINRPTVLLWTTSKNLDLSWRSISIFSAALLLCLMFLFCCCLFCLCICIIKKEKEAFSFLCVKLLMRKLTLCYQCLLTLWLLP